MGKKRGYYNNADWTANSKPGNSIALIDKKDLADQSKRIKAVIAGEKITVRDWEIFEAFYRQFSGSISRTADAMGMSQSNIYRLTKKKWWSALVVEMISERQNAFFLSLAEDIDHLKKAILDIWKGDFPVGLAMAAVKSFEVFSRMGKGVGNQYIEPLIQSRRELFEPIQTNINVTNITVNMADKIAELTLDELSDYSKYGKIPERFIEYKPDDAEIEGEYIESE